MSLQPYKDSTSAREMELVQARVTPEEAEKRQKEVRLYTYTKSESIQSTRMTFVISSGG